MKTDKKDEDERFDGNETRRENASAFWKLHSKSCSGLRYTVCIGKSALLFDQTTTSVS